ncbi:MAG: DUF4867 family protein [Oscillospiraceae bacterium]|jgi:hypothetical protein|nr:DUF4867 family protein [Oscillospiraceae bacterium]
MEIKSIFDAEFSPYGQVHKGYKLDGLLAAMKAIPLPESGTTYQPTIPELEALPIFELFGANAYGGMPVQLGMCWGRNTKLNCLEYHRDSEFNVGTHDFILLLAKQDEIVDGMLDTAKVRAFRVPAGVLVEVYATTLHYAPCHTDEAEGFRVAVALPRGTNEAKPAIKAITEEDQLLWARNKWLLAHEDSAEAGQGAAVRLSGDNNDIANDI